MTQENKMASAVRFEPAIPLLRIFSEPLAKAFYLDFLGFKIDWEHRFEDGLPLYAQISRDALVLHLTGHYGDATPGSTVFIHMQGIDAYNAELLAKQHGNARPGLHDQPWGRTMEIADPFGNRLRFCEPPA
jgi:hypothetical protein